MFTRVVKTTTKPGKFEEFSRTFTEKALPLMRQQAGFIDEIELVSQENPDSVLTLSFWKTREDADKYNREVFSRVVDIVRNVIVGEPQLSTYLVTASTIHNIATGKAA